MTKFWQQDWCKTGHCSAAHRYWINCKIMLTIHFRVIYFHYNREKNTYCWAVYIMHLNTVLCFSSFRRKEFWNAAFVKNRNRCTNYVYVLNPTSKNKYFVIICQAGEGANIAAMCSITKQYKIFPSFSDNYESIKTHAKIFSLRPAIICRHCNMPRTCKILITAFKHQTHLNYI